MEIIPAIDIIDGKCVRLTQGDYRQMTIYHEHPLEVAKQFEQSGLRRLHLVDLDGARLGRVQNWKVLEILAAQTQLQIDFGGGIKQEADLKMIFESGAHLATIGSLAVKDELLFSDWITRYGAEKFLLGADVKKGKIAVGGWLETSDWEIHSYLENYQSKGIRQVFCTDISKDGKLLGPSLELYESIIQKFPQLYFIASGGVSSMQDLLDLKAIGCSGAIVGKAYYEGRLSLEDIKIFTDGLA